MNVDGFRDDMRKVSAEMRAGRGLWRKNACCANQAFVNRIRK